MRLAKFPVIVSIDSDLENPPELIPNLISELGDYDLVVASRSTLPRLSEKWASKTLGKIVGVSDFYSNFRVYKKQTVFSKLTGGETFGGELLVIAKKGGFRLGEVKYVAPTRRIKPRIGGSIRANWRITVASLKCFFLFLL
jgi:dolichol-phosphate mannosyltransferase